MYKKLDKRFEVFGENPNTLDNAIYVLCDYATLLKKNYTLKDFLKKIETLDVKVLQYRNKTSSKEAIKADLVYLKKHCTYPIIVNDYIELIEYCDGLHMGQEDFLAIHENKSYAIKIVRKKLGDKLLGLSCHNELEILEANELDLDMIGLGAYRSTNTKDVDNILSNKLEYLAKVSTHPVCAIGGVKKSDYIKNVNFKVIGSDLYED